jgi:hypothetical protein
MLMGFSLLLQLPQLPFCTTTSFTHLYSNILMVILFILPNIIHSQLFWFLFTSPHQVVTPFFCF